MRYLVQATHNEYRIAIAAYSKRESGDGQRLTTDAAARFQVDLIVLITGSIAGKTSDPMIKSAHQEANVGPRRVIADLGPLETVEPLVFELLGPRFELLVDLEWVPALSSGGPRVAIRVMAGNSYEIALRHLFIGLPSEAHPTCRTQISQDDRDVAPVKSLVKPL